jgi:hypothetical protein
VFQSLRRSFVSVILSSHALPHKAKVRADGSGLDVPRCAHSTLYRHVNSGRHFLFDSVLTAMWCLILLLYATKPFFSEWRVTADSLALYLFNRRGKNIPYRSVVAVRRQPDAKDPDTLEIETASISPDVYPHSYVIITPKDRTGLLQALRTHLPPAIFETT